MASNCKVIRAEIEESVGGAWLSRGAEAHLAACAGCLDFYHERGALRRLVGELERVGAPGDFEFRLRARMAAAKETKGTRPLVFRFAPGFASFALAAVFVAAVAGAYYFKRAAPAVADHAAPQPSSTAATRTVADQPTPPAAPTAGPVVEVSTKVSEQAGGSPSLGVERAGGVRQPKPERRLSAARAAAAEPRRESAAGRTGGELNFGLSTSPVIKASNVKLEVSAEPLRMVVRDESGAARRVAMKPVSFGAQNPVGKPRAVSNTSLADDEGVW
jgi:hypothetical protein